MQNAEVEKRCKKCKIVQNMLSKRKKKRSGPVLDTHPRNSFKTTKNLHQNTKDFLI